MHTPGPDADAISFVLALGKALHRYGTPAHRLEEALNHCCGQLGLEAEMFTTPTTIIMSFGAPVELKTRMMRVENSELDMSKLAEVDALADLVAGHHITAAEGIARLATILSAPPLFRGPLSTAVHAVTAGALAVFFGGALPDVAVAAGIGLALGVLAQYAARSTDQARVFEVLGAAFAMRGDQHAHRHRGGLGVRGGEGVHALLHAAGRELLVLEGVGAVAERYQQPRGVVGVDEGAVVEERDDVPAAVPGLPRPCAGLVVGEALLVDYVIVEELVEDRDEVFVHRGASGGRGSGRYAACPVRRCWRWIMRWPMSARQQFWLYSVSLARALSAFSELAPYFVDGDLNTSRFDGRGGAMAR